MLNNKADTEQTVASSVVYPTRTDHITRYKAVNNMCLNTVVFMHGGQISIVLKVQPPCYAVHNKIERGIILQLANRHINLTT